MDWQEIRQALCDARGFKPVHDGHSVRTDTMMPSGAVIRVHIQLRDGRLSIHDNGAAFDELARHGGELKSSGGVKRMLAETDFQLMPTGEIFRHDIDPAQVGVGVALVADASLRAATFMLAHAKVKTGLPLDVRLKNSMLTRYPAGRADFKVDGKARLQKFDFGLQTENEIIVLDAVSPDLSSVNAAIVKSLDAKQAPEIHARPILVYDDDQDHWPADAMNLLAMAGERVSFRSLDEGQFRLAA
ncbi:hypothetical protein [Sphingobium sp. TCM1]|uniref:hypothetical protein n=1 Tax=Sphingobium sp. TCM1 TaxID=453246 RepID=UPI0007F3B772|nr:hypothetical protein [Sphingobium sp. TCM1]OAN52831.1 hypothetical protein A7Q26_06445 [Sphingobium sp. TCM1]